MHRHAGLLREAAHDDGMEGADQRPPPGRDGRRQHRAADGARPAAQGARARASGGVRVPRPDHAPVHLRRGVVGRHRRADHREPDPPAARVRTVDAGRVQEPDRRQRPGRRRRGPSGRRVARLRRDRPRRDAGDPVHARQPGLSHHPARRRRRAQPPSRAGGAGARAPARGRVAAATGDRRLARQQRQGRAPAAHGGRRSGRADHGGLERDHRSDARVVPRRRLPAAGRPGRPHLRPVDHRRLHRLGDHGRRPRRPGRSGPRSAGGARPSRCGWRSSASA